LPVINLISLQPGETITTLLPVRDFSAGSYLFFCTQNGRVKRTKLEQFSSVRSSGLIAIGLDEDDALAWVRMTSGEDELILVTEMGRAVRFAEEDVRPMGRTAAGVIGVRMATKNRVIAAEVVQPDADLFVISRNGYGKRTPLEEFHRRGRGGTGVTAMKMTERNGLLAAARVINDDDSLMMVSERGMVIRVAANQISRIGRTTQGVSVMRLNDGDQLASITRISTDVEAELADVTEASVGDSTMSSPNGVDHEES
jgi:DNA gyrase subunit A